ncbi:nitroreductase [Moraxella nasovis]|uniref:nitroreductase family protein n=1 Tax=Moraxella nasovis TaxID=2904121 RepID=UPI001F5FFC22|nr:nitroreductase [Moraxella nasovis]UNU73191.1 nitroreductase [Moraxella nasovis]
MVNSIIETIQKRRSIGKLYSPMPNNEELFTAIGCATVAPDHKQLQPYHFTVLTDVKLEEFGRVLLQAGEQRAKRLGEGLTKAARQKFINMPNRAPMIIAVTSCYRTHDKVPKFEQILAIGASIQNLLLAFTSMGYQSIWRTGDLCNESAVKHYFGVDDDNIVCGFIYVGSSDVIMPDREISDLHDIVTIK